VKRCVERPTLGITLSPRKGLILTEAAIGSLEQVSPLQQRASNVVFCDIGWSYETLFLSGVRSARFT
jgi:hypothetical protein